MEYSAKSEKDLRIFMLISKFMLDLNETVDQLDMVDNVR